MISLVSHVRASMRSNYFAVNDWWMMKCMPFLSLCLEEPLKTRVRTLLKRVARCRKMTWPCHQASLA